MSLSRLAASWNYCNPGELLLMRQTSAAIQLPSTNSRYLTEEEEDSHLEKIKMEKKKNTNQQVNCSGIPPGNPHRAHHLLLRI